MTTTEQRDAAREKALAKRAEVGAVRRKLRTCELSLTDVMSNPPPELARYPLIDVIRWTRTQGRPLGRSLVAIGEQAIRDDVNLLIPLGEASLRSRAWVAEWGMYWKPLRAMGDEPRHLSAVAA